MAATPENIAHTHEFNHLVKEISLRIKRRRGKAGLAEKWAEDVKEVFLWSRGGVLNMMVMVRANDYQRWYCLKARLEEMLVLTQNVAEMDKLIRHLETQKHNKCSDQDWCMNGIYSYMAAHYEAYRTKFSYSRVAYRRNTEAAYTVAIEDSNHTKEFSTLVNQIRTAIRRKVKARTAEIWWYEMEECFLFENGTETGMLNAWVRSRAGDHRKWNCLKRRLQEMLLLAKTDSELGRLVEQLEGESVWSANGIFRFMQDNYASESRRSDVVQSQKSSHLCLVQ